MRRFVLLILLFSCCFSLAQAGSDSIVKSTVDSAAKTDFGLSTYLFTYPLATISKLTTNSGSIAIGPSASFFNNKRFGLQLGVLFDLKVYKYYSYYGGVLQGGVNISTKRNLIIPILINYRLYKNHKITCFLMAGILFGGRYYSDGTQYAKQTLPINLIAGPGICWNFYKRLSLRISSTITISFDNHPRPNFLIDFFFRAKHA
jgi:hypothetical protein